MPTSRGEGVVGNIYSLERLFFKKEVRKIKYIGYSYNLEAQKSV